MRVGWEKRYITLVARGLVLQVLLGHFAACLVGENSSGNAVQVSGFEWQYACGLDGEMMARILLSYHTNTENHLLCLESNGQQSCTDVGAGLSRFSGDFVLGDGLGRLTLEANRTEPTRFAHLEDPSRLSSELVLVEQLRPSLLIEPSVIMTAQSLLMIFSQTNFGDAPLTHEPILTCGDEIVPVNSWSSDQIGEQLSLEIVSDMSNGLRGRLCVLTVFINTCPAVHVFHWPDEVTPQPRTQKHKRNHQRFLKSSIPPGYHLMFGGPVEGVFRGRDSDQSIWVDIDSAQEFPMSVSTVLGRGKSIEWVSKSIALHPVNIWFEALLNDPDGADSGKEWILLGVEHDLDLNDFELIINGRICSLAGEVAEGSRVLFYRDTIPEQSPEADYAFDAICRPLTNEALAIELKDRRDGYVVASFELESIRTHSDDVWVRNKPPSETLPYEYCAVASEVFERSVMSESMMRCGGEAKGF